MKSLEPELVDDAELRNAHHGIRSELAARTTGVRCQDLCIDEPLSVFLVAGPSVLNDLELRLEPTVTLNANDDIFHFLASMKNTVPQRAP